MVLNLIIVAQNILAHRKKFQTPKKEIRGVNRLIKEVESEYFVLEDS